MPFAKHNTFHIREGWLFKGMAAIKTAEAEGQPATIFRDKDAPEKLGIGRNMVFALRFWMQATGLTKETSENRLTVQRLTPFGEMVWKCDRFLENEGTLWLIHYNLACSQNQATTWFWFFNHYAPVAFDDHTCLEALSRWIVTIQPDKPIALSSLKKDVDCLLKTYLVDHETRTPENLIESPLGQLNLLSQVEDGPRKRYRMERLDPARLDPLILLYVLTDQQARKENPREYQVKLSQVLREPMNAGRVFNLTTAALTDLLAELNKQHADWGVRFDRTAGLDQITLRPIEPLEILGRYYTEKDLTWEGV